MLHAAPRGWAGRRAREVDRAHTQEQQKEKHRHHPGDPVHEPQKNQKKRPRNDDDLAPTQGQRNQTPHLRLGKTLDATSAITVAKRFYSWKTSDLIGQGSYGHVFLARCLVSHRVVAVKVVSADGEGWEREFELMSALQHPHIAECLDSFIVEGSGVAVLAFVAADTDLRMFLSKRDTKVSLQLACCISRDMLRGLEYLHGCGVVHRDIKPANTLLTLVDVGEIHVALCDFGMARKIPSTDTGPSDVLSADDAGPSGAATPLVQTAGYRAPEVVVWQCSTNGPCTSAMDMWSFGCVLFELLFFQRVSASERRREQLGTYVAVLGPCPSDVPWSKSAEFATCSAGHKDADVAVLWGSLSEVPRQVISSCLAWHPSRRSSAEQCLSSTWYVGQESHCARAQPIPAPTREQPEQAPHVEAPLSSTQGPRVGPPRAPTQYCARWLFSHPGSTKTTENAKLVVRVAAIVTNLGTATAVAVTRSWCRMGNTAWIAPAPSLVVSSRGCAVTCAALTRTCRLDCHPTFGCCPRRFRVRAP
jgi:mitogen-activated protein kinase 1/3